ncbi:MFS transporter superfamily [Sesbania bispinosa]|nr:MFS transporter superfamily [Sesbania bispinosa]
MCRKVMAGELGVMNALDMAKEQWYHFTAIVIAGMSFFTDAYDLLCISLVTKLLGRIYYTYLTAPKPRTGVALCGTLAGQLFFRWFGDKLGRKRGLWYNSYSHGSVFLGLRALFWIKYKVCHGHPMFLKVLAWFWDWR